MTTSASRLASQARAHQRNSGRRLARASSAKNAAAIASDVSWTIVLQRHSRSCCASSIFQRPYVGDVGYRFIAGEGRFEQVNSREAVHVAADRQPEEIQNGRRQIDHRRARRPARRHRRAKREHETIRRRVRACR